MIIAALLLSVMVRQDPQEAAPAPLPGVASRAVINPRDDIAFKALAIPDTVWVGQQATYQVGVFLSDEIRTKLRRNPVFVPPELRSMLSYDLASLVSPARYAGSRRYEVHVFQRALFPLTAGLHEIPPSRLEYAVPLSNSFFAREESHAARTEGLVVVAREPPQAGRPDDFRGAVGRLSIRSRLDLRNLRTGDPFKFTMTVTGTGNVSLLPRPDLRVSWADVVPGAVRVQMDSTTQLVRGRKEFDWIVTPLQPGRQSMPVVRYPFFNPYTERYEVALTRPEPVTVTGTPVAVDRAAAEPAPALTVRRAWSGEVPLPVTDSGWFWAIIAAAPLPLAGLIFAGRPARTRSPRSAEALLVDAARSNGADAALVRRLFAAGVAGRVMASPADMSDRVRLTRTLRLAGVSDGTASAAAGLLASLDGAVFGGLQLDEHDAAERAASLLRAVDEEARARYAISARNARKAAGILAVFLGMVMSSAAAPAGRQSSPAPRSGSDPVAVKVFTDGLVAYDAREFGSARQAFLELTQARPRSADAWFNFGNASWLLEDTAAAVIGWNKALRLEPMADDIRERLLLAPGEPRRWQGVPPVTMNLLAVVGASTWVAGFALLAWWQRRRRAFMRRGGMVFVTVALLVLIVAIRQGDTLAGKAAAVVLSPTHLRSLPVLSGEAGVEALPGEIVHVLGAQGAWSRIELQDGRRGWVEARRIQGLE